VSFSEVQGHISGELWKRIECDATGRFVYATRYLNVNTQTSQAYRSDSYGAPGTWVPANMNSIEDIWVSATGQFMAGVSVPNTGLSNNRYLVYSSEYGRNIQILSLGNTTLFRTINGSADGSVLVLGSGNISEGSPSYSGDGFIRVARQGRPVFNDSGIADTVLWFSGAIDITTITSRIALPFTSAGKIDLANYHIQYEIDINWNLEETTPPPITFISMGFYGDYATNSNVATNNNVRAANTIWTRKTNNSTASFPLDIASTTVDQAFNNVFLCGYAPGQGVGLSYRYRTMMKGEISRATTRPAQVGTSSADFAPNSRLVMNRFFADAVLYDNEAGTDALEFYHPTLEGQGQHHIQGTAVWEMNRENKYSVIQNGVEGLFIDLNNNASGFESVLRRGYITYRIYRVRK
jgi:hypothetical protein